VSLSALLELEEKAEALLPDAAINSIVDIIYSLDVSSWEDEGLAVVEGIIEKLIRVLTSADVHQHAEQIERLLKARRAIEQGLSPDPSKRPTLDEVRAIVSNHLH
jgi:hypothetical protein